MALRAQAFVGASMARPRKHRAHNRSLSCARTRDNELAKEQVLKLTPAQQHAETFMFEARADQARWCWELCAIAIDHPQLRALVLELRPFVSKLRHVVDEGSAITLKVVRLRIAARACLACMAQEVRREEVAGSAREMLAL